MIDCVNEGSTKEGSPLGIKFPEQEALGKSAEAVEPP